MPNALSQFSFQTNAVRTIAENGEIWFVAKDVAQSLEYSSTNMTTIFSAVPEEWKGSKPIATLGGNQKLLMISEQGLYFFLGRSDKPKALPFQKWLAGEVLPAIRKTGSYSVSISKAQQGELATLIAERFPSGKDRPYAWSRFNNHFRLASYKDLPANRFQEACQYIRTMQLPHALPSPSSSMKPVVWTHPDGYVGPKWEDKGIPRDDRAIKQIIFELTQWGRENLPKGEVANSFEDAMNDLRQLQITCWTHIDEALSSIAHATGMLHRWQARNGRIGNVS